MSQLPLLITPATLASVKEDANLLILDLSDPELYQQAHIPRAFHIHPSETQWGRPPTPGLLPTKENLVMLIKRIGLRDEHHVVTYDDEGGGWAGRMIWLLDSIGFKNSSLLSGGLQAWQDAGLPVTSKIPQATADNFKIALNPDTSISADELDRLIDKGTISIWDARSLAEFNGQRKTALQNGHIPGAIHYEWTRAMDLNNARQIRDLEILREELAAAGLDDSKQVITHCHSHHRSGLTYLLGKALGFNIRAYPGSWSEWGNNPLSRVE